MLSVSAVLANSIIVTGIDPSLGLQSIYVNEKGTPTSIYWSGAIDISVDGYIRQVFCVQLFTDIYIGNAYSTTMDFSDTANVKRVGWLLQNQFPTAPHAGAAFQLAIWDIIEDSGNGFQSGTVSQSTDLLNPTDPGILAAAAQYETVSAGKTSDLGIVYHNFLGTTPVQTLMGNPVSDEGPSPAPEPASIAMIIGGLVLIGVSRLRQRRIASN